MRDEQRTGEKVRKETWAFWRHASPPSTTKETQESVKVWMGMALEMIQEMVVKMEVLWKIVMMLRIKLMTALK